MGLYDNLYNCTEVYVSPVLRSVYILGDGKLFDDIIARMLTSVANLRIIVMSLEHKNVQVLDRLAGQIDTWNGIPYTLQGVDDWNVQFDLVAGKQRR